MAVENDLIVSAQLELSEIDRQLADVEPLQKRRAEILEFLRIAGTMKPVSAHTDSMLDALLQPKGTLKEQVTTGAKRLLSPGGNLQTRDILRGLEKSGVTIPGDTEGAKVIRISQILGKSDDFVVERGRGWSLRQQQLDHPKVKGPAAIAVGPLGHH